MMIDVSTCPVERFVQAIALRDFSLLESVLDANVQFRALIPPGVREATTPSGTRECIERWFSDSDEFEMVSNSVRAVGDRIHATYRLHGREDGARYVCEQQLYASVGKAGIEKLDLMCSGFRPRTD